MKKGEYEADWREVTARLIRAKLFITKTLIIEELVNPKSIMKTERVEVRVKFNSVIDFYTAYSKLGHMSFIYGLRVFVSTDEENLIIRWNF